MFMCGKSIKDSVIGFVGAGRIGCAILERLIPFKAKQLLYCGNKARPGVESLGAQFVSFDELLEKSDFVIVCCLLTDRTRHMFNESAFKRMKSTALLINTSRGAVVDQTALYNALTNRDISGAGLDVMQVEPIPADDPLLSLDNVGRSLSRIIYSYTYMYFPHCDRSSSELISAHTRSIITDNSIKPN